MIGTCKVNIKSKCLYSNKYKESSLVEKNAKKIDHSIYCDYVFVCVLHTYSLGKYMGVFFFVFGLWGFSPSTKIDPKPLDVS